MVSYKALNTSYKSNRYNFRTNLDYKVASNFKLSLNIASYLEKVNTPQTAKLFNNSVDELVTNMRAYIWATPPTDPGPLRLQDKHWQMGRMFLPVKL